MYAHTDATSVSSVCTHLDLRGGQGNLRVSRSPAQSRELGFTGAEDAADSTWSTRPTQAAPRHPHNVPERQR